MVTEFLVRNLTHRRAEIVRALATAGANVNARDYIGRSPLYFERVQKASVNRTGANFQARGKFSPEECRRNGQEP